MSDCGSSKLWRKGRLLGQGGYASVYLGYSKNPILLPPVMAVKTAPLSASSSLEQEKRFLDWFHGCSNIIQCFGSEKGFDENGEQVYNLFLEFAAGGCLYDLIEKRHRCGFGFSDLEVKHYARCILQGLSTIHQMGFVHCDLKPENVLLFADPLSPNFVAKIADFGLSKTRGKAKTCRGTTQYIAPETVLFHIQETPSDIWAVGLIILEMLMGTPPWGLDCNAGAKVLFPRIVSEDIVSLIPPHISKEAKSFLACCLQKHPLRRWTAEDLLGHPFLVSQDYEDLLVKLDELGAWNVIFVQPSAGMIMPI